MTALVRHFVVDGNPIGKERARTVRTKQGAVRSFTPTKTKQYEERVAMNCRVALGRGWKRDGKFAIALAIYHDTNVFPDISNVVKSVEDGCQGVAWNNDKDIWLVNAERHVGKPRVEVTLWRQDD